MIQTCTDILFPRGKTYVLVIDTDKYSGNFEREMAGWVAGAYDEDRGHGDREYREFKEQTSEDGENEIAERVELAVTSVKHNEYDYVQNGIWPTPNRLNNGSGSCRDAEPDETGWPAYESVAIFFNRKLTKDEMEFVRKRAQRFSEEWVPRFGNRETPKILDVYMLEVERADVMVNRLDI